MRSNLNFGAKVKISLSAPNIFSTFYHFSGRFLLTLQHIKNLVVNLPQEENLGSIDLVLEAGAANGSYQIGCLLYLKELENQNVRISLPITMKNNDMDLYQWSSTDILILNKFGIPEPQKIEKVVPDILLIPLVSFDKNLFRIGYGGGFYDRYIEKVSKLKKTLNIGIAHSCQKVSKVPLNKYDKKLDIVITEKYILS